MKDLTLIILAMSRCLTDAMSMSILDEKFVCAARLQKLGELNKKALALLNTDKCKSDK